MGTSQEHVMSRRRLLVAAGVLSIAPSLLNASRVRAAQAQLTVAVYGGQLGDAVRTGSIKAFEQATGAKVQEEVGVSTVTLGKLREQKANPTIDVAWMDGGVSEVAQAEGLVDTIDLAALPNGRDLFPEAVHKDSTGGVYAITGGFYSIGISYNRQQIKNPPASWKDLWRSEYAGKVTTASPINATWPNWFAHMCKVFGGDMDHIDPFIDAMKRLKVAAFWDAAGQSDNFFQAGEVDVGVHVHGNSWGLRDKGLPIVFVVPKEGAVAGDVRVHLVKGTKNKELALKYIDAVAGPAGQKSLIEMYAVGPGNRKVDIPSQYRHRMPYGATGSIKNLAIPDWFAINARKAKWIERWNKDVVGKR